MYLKETKYERKEISFKKSLITIFNIHLKYKSNFTKNLLLAN